MDGGKNNFSLHSGQVIWTRLHWMDIGHFDSKLCHWGMCLLGYMISKHGVYHILCTWVELYYSSSGTRENSVWGLNFPLCALNLHFSCLLRPRPVLDLDLQPLVSGPSDIYTLHPGGCVRSPRWHVPGRAWLPRLFFISEITVGTVVSNQWQEF